MRLPQWPEPQSRSNQLVIQLKGRQRPFLLSTYIINIPMQYTRTRNPASVPTNWAGFDRTKKKVRNTDPIIFYCDHRGMELDNIHTMNRFLMQDIPTRDGTIDRLNFTHHPLIDVSVLEDIERGVEIRTFKDGILPGRDSIIHIGLMSGWTQEKLNNISRWLNQPNRRALLDDPRCHIVLDYSLEGFTDYAYDDIWSWIEQNFLHERVIYVSGASNCEEIYQRWCSYNRVRPNMRCAWYGFFADWVARRVPKDKTLAVNYKPGSKRIMCLNRRPHEHRMLLAAMIERNHLTEKIALSFPRGLNEDQDYQLPGYDNVGRLWKKFCRKSDGWLDYLTPAWQSLEEKLPLVADTSDFDTNHAGDLNIGLYEQYPVNVITETIFFTRGTFPSEKIWKPIAMGQIFIPMAGSFFLRELRKMGFETFSPWINEDYDTIDDDHDRATAIVAEMRRLVEMPEHEFVELLSQCQTRIQHNQRLFLERNNLQKIVAQQFLDKVNAI